MQGFLMPSLLLRIMNVSFTLKSCIPRLCFFLSGVIVPATGLKLLYLYQMLQPEDAMRESSFLPLFFGIGIIDSLMFVGICFVIWRNYRTDLAQPMSKLSQIIHGIQIKRADLASDLSVTHCVEIDELSQATNSMLKQIKSLMSQLHEVGQKITEASKTAFLASKNQSTLLVSQVTSSREMATAIREFVIATQQIREDITSVVDVANRTLQRAKQGQHTVMKVVESMQDIQQSSHISSGKIMALGKRSEHINEVVRTIDRIIEDTKLIAFNATIEAARAKEEGKGFGVVALEIKRLAEEVFESTEDIKELIQEIQTASHALVLATEEEMKTVARGARLAEDAGTALTQIFDMAKLTTESAQRIASATQQQKTTSEQVLHSVETANQATNTFSQESRHLAVTAAELSILADGLGQIIADFGVEGYARRTSDS